MKGLDRKKTYVSPRHCGKELNYSLLYYPVCNQLELRVCKLLIETDRRCGIFWYNSEAVTFLGGWIPSRNDAMHTGLSDSHKGTYSTAHPEENHRRSLRILISYCMSTARNRKFQIVYYCVHRFKSITK